MITTLNRNWRELKIICCSAHFFTRLVTKLVVSQAFSCSLLLSLPRFGSLWLFLAHSGSLWPTLAVSGAHGLPRSLLGTLHRGCVATVYQALGAKVSITTFSFRNFKTFLACNLMDNIHQTLKGLHQWRRKSCHCKLHILLLFGDQFHNVLINPITIRKFTFLYCATQLKL